MDFHWVALLILAKPQGPTCHLGIASCFGDEVASGPGWLAELSSIVASRANHGDASSYTRKLIEQGLNRIAQKVGEEAVELALASVTSEPGACAEEAADLLYHLTVLMQAKGFGWDDVIGVLRTRHERATELPS